MIAFNERTQEFENVSASSEEEIAQVILGAILIIVGIPIFLCYAQEEFGNFWGVLYSLYWPITVPIDLIFF